MTDDAPLSYDITLRDYIDQFRIGVWDDEQGRRQRVRINARLTLPWPAHPLNDRLDAVLSYDFLITGIRALRDGEHVHLVETLAERVLTLCFSDPRVVKASVQIEKLDIVPESAGVGVVIERSRPAAP